jgi:hypothetical protein
MSTMSRSAKAMRGGSLLFKKLFRGADKLLETFVLCATYAQICGPFCAQRRSPKRQKVRNLQNIKTHSQYFGALGVGLVTQVRAFE